MRRFLALASAALLALGACDSADPSLSTLADASAPRGGARWAGPDTPALAEVAVMTQNLYLGAEILQLLDPPCSGFTLLVCVDRLYGQALASDFPARAERIADEIARVRPALVGLQEVTTYATQMPGDYLTGTTAPNATAVTVDFLAVLLDALADRGLSYAAVSVNANTDVELPAFDGQAFYDVRYRDADVVLALRDPDVSVGATTEHTFQALVTFPVGGVPVPFLRGYQTVEATVDGLPLTFVNTHLEVGAAGPIQEAQAAELRAALGAVAGPVVLVGDLNSPADGSGTRSYALLTEALTDVFSRPNLRPEPTCCQAADLQNVPSALDERIDFVLYRGLDQARKGEVVLDQLGDRVESLGTLLWPSDHAGVAALLVHNLQRNRPRA